MADKLCAGRHIAHPPASTGTAERKTHHHVAWAGRQVHGHNAGCAWTRATHIGAWCCVKAPVVLALVGIPAIGRRGRVVHRVGRVASVPLLLLLGNWLLLLLMSLQQLLLLLWLLPRPVGPRLRVAHARCCPAVAALELLGLPVKGGAAVCKSVLKLGNQIDMYGVHRRL